MKLITVFIHDTGLDDDLAEALSATFQDQAYPKEIVQIDSIPTSMARQAWDTLEQELRKMIWNRI